MREQCCPGDHDPFRVPPICVRCGDARTVSTTETQRKDELTPCPFCGDPAARLELVRQRLAATRPRPTISEDGLSDAERALVRDWRNRGYHMQDCLRWIEGQRYEPANDEAFLRNVHEQLTVWRFLSGRVGPPQLTGGGR